MGTGQKINASEYNDIRTKVEQILGTGGVIGGTRGYGQKLLSTPVVAESDLITVDQWKALKTDITNVKLHQSNILPSLVDVSTNDTIRYGSSYPNTNYDDVINQLIPTRLSLGEGRSTTTVKDEVETTNTWASLAYAEITVTFTGYSIPGGGSVSAVNHARYFFNSGSVIRLTSSRTGGAATAHNNSWSSLLTSIGGQNFTAELPSNLNFYNLTNVYNTVYEYIASTPFSANRYKIEAKCDVADNQTATATVVYFRVSWIDNYSGTGDTVDGTLKLTVSEVKDTSAIFQAGDTVTPTGTWYLPSPTYSVTSITTDSPAPPPASEVVCISVIDESSQSQTTLNNSWTTFRTNYPNRPFYLLQPLPRVPADLKPPAAFTADALAYGPTSVNRDKGVIASRSDWFTICGLESLTPGSKVALSIDSSGSLGKDDVQASYNLFISKVSSAGLVLTEVAMTAENWITPFNRVF